MIFNPAAKGQKAERFRRCLATIAAGCDLKRTTGPGDARMSELNPVAPRVQVQALFRVRVNAKYGYINRTGDVVIPPRFGHCGGYSEGLAWASEASVGLGVYGYIDEQGD